jgi:hypothetical protein
MDDRTRWCENDASNGTRPPGLLVPSRGPAFFSSILPDLMTLVGVMDFSRPLTHQFQLTTHSCRWAVTLLPQGSSQQG